MTLESKISSYRDYLIKLLKKKNMNARTEDIEDCVQNSLIKAIRHCKQWKGECSLKTWLTVITLRMYSESFRKQYTSQECLLNSTNDEYIFESMVEDDFSQALCNEQNYQDIINALFSGFENNVHIEAFKMSVIDEIDYKDIAIKQNIPMGTVKSRMFRAKKLLQDKYLAICDKYESGV